MDYKSYVGKFVGPYQIKECLLANEKTFLDKEKIKLIYEEGKEELLPMEVLNKIITKGRSDLTTLREMRVEPVVEKLLVILAESELSKVDINYAIGPKLTESLNQSLKIASEKLWGKDADSITLMDIEKILKKKKDESKQESRSKSRKSSSK